MTIEFYPGFYYATGMRAVLPAFYVPLADDNWSFSFSEKHGKDAYKRACRFERLLERGYAPKMAYKLSSVGICPTLKTFEREFVASMHDKLTDEIPPFIPAGYEVEEFSIDELATSELRSIVLSWYRDGDEALFIASEEYSVAFNELRAYVHGLVQHDDENADHYTGHSHTALVAY